MRRTGVNLNDGTWIVTEIHRATSVPGSTNESSAVVGHFYSQTTSALAAYDLPGGALLKEFTAGSFSENPPVPDGRGGVFLQETWELTITDATGIYSPYKGGHNHMVDRLDALPGGLADNSDSDDAHVGRLPFESVDVAKEAAESYTA